MDKHGKAAVQIRLSFYGIPTAEIFQPCYLLAAFFSVGIIYFTLAAPYGKIILCVLKLVDFDHFNFFI